MYQGSPRTSIPDMRGLIQHHSPQKASHHRASPSQAQLLSPSHRRTQGTTSSGSSSPMTIGCDAIQYGGVYNMPSAQHMFVDHAISPVPSSTSSRNTSFQSPSHSRSTSMTGMKNLMRDRSIERVGSAEYGGPLVRDRSLDRQLDRHAFIQRKDGRDRSLDREYIPGRTIERDSINPSLGGVYRGRLGSLDADLYLDSASPTPSMQSHIVPSEASTSQSVIMDFHSDMACLNRECSKLQQELELTKEKLSSTMNSIKAFWSPELKKERALRKEESSRYSLLSEQLRSLSSDKQQLTLTVANLEDQLRSTSHHEHNHVNATTNLPGSDEADKIRRERDKQNKELIILHKTVEELELRVDTQKQTLCARNESIKKLLEMLQSKGLNVKQIQSDIAEVEKHQSRAFEEEKKRKELESVLLRRDDEMKRLNEQMESLRKHLSNGVNGGTGYGNNKADTSLQVLIESKDSKISQLEGDVRLLEEELIKLREDGLVTPRDRTDDKHVQSLKSRERLLKGKIDNMIGDSARKDSELCALQTKLETSEKQSMDQQHYVAVLKEQIKAKDQRANIQQSDTELLRCRIQDKDLVNERKSKALIKAETDKKDIESELKQLQDQFDIKDRKINVLQRKIDNLDDSMSDKDSQLTAAKARINSMHTDQSSSDSALSSLEDSLTDKDRQIERLKDQRDRVEKEHTEEMTFHTRTVQELKHKIDNSQQELNDKQVSLFELRDELSEVRAGKLKKESDCNQLELQVSYKNDEILELNEDVHKLKEQVTANASILEADKRNSDLEQQMDHLNETVSKSHQEVDRLLTILKEMETEKHEKDNQIKELQEQIKEFRQRAGTMKRNQQVEKTKNAELLEEARKREEGTSGEGEQIKNQLEQRQNRVEELEEALRESVRITADRELLIAEQQHMLEESELKIAEQYDEIDHFEGKTFDQGDKLKSMAEQLEEKERKLRKFQDERRRHLEEVFEMKQEAILAAITEKDATIGVLEMSSTNTAQAAGEVDKLIKEKQKLQIKLKEVTQNQMKLIQIDEAEEKVGNSSKDHKMAEKMKRASTDQEATEDGIWA